MNAAYLNWENGDPMLADYLSGKKVFVDLKLHDIGNTVARGVEVFPRSARRSSPCMPIRRPCRPRSRRVEVRARRFSPSPFSPPTTRRICAWRKAVRHTIADLVATRARQAKALGIDGLVCSPEEVKLRAIVGNQMSLVTPGIRPAGSSSGDQKRIMTPARAIAAGADYLVVGRPVVEAADPKAAAD